MEKDCDAGKFRIQQRVKGFFAEGDVSWRVVTADGLAPRSGAPRLAHCELKAQAGGLGMLLESHDQGDQKLLRVVDLVIERPTEGHYTVAR